MHIAKVSSATFIDSDCVPIALVFGTKCAMQYSQFCFPIHMQIDNVDVNFDIYLLYIERSFVAPSMF